MFSCLPRCGRTRFPARVRKLHTRHCALLLDETKNAREHFDVFVFPDSQVLRADAPFRQHGSRFRDKKRRAADRTTPEMHQMPVVREAIDARILAHRRDADAIAQPHVAQSQRREKVRGRICRGAHVIVTVT